MQGEMINKLALTSFMIAIAPLCLIEGIFSQDLLFTKYTKGRELYWRVSDTNGMNWKEDRKLAGMGGHYQLSNEREGRVITAFNMHPRSRSPIHEHGLSPTGPGTHGPFGRSRHRCTTTIWGRSTLRLMGSGGSLPQPNLGRSGMGPAVRLPCGSARTKGRVGRSSTTSRARALSITAMSRECTPRLL